MTCYISSSTVHQFRQNQRRGGIVGTNRHNINAANSGTISGSTISAIVTKFDQNTEALSTLAAVFTREQALSLIAMTGTGGTFNVRTGHQRVRRQSQWHAGDLTGHAAVITAATM